MGCSLHVNMSHFALSCCAFDALQYNYKMLQPVTSMSPAQYMLIANISLLYVKRLSHFILQVLITFYHISTLSISSACLFIEKLVTNIIVSRNTAWHGKGIVSVYHTAYFLTSTRALQMPDLQIPSKVSFFANKNIPLTFAPGLFVI